MLDSFPNSWFGGKLKIAPCFHLNSRDSYLTGKVENMRLMFRDQVMIGPQVEVAALLKADVCTRFASVKDAIIAEHQRRFSRAHPFATDKEAWKADFKKPMPKDNGGLKRPVDGPKSTVNTLSLDKSWMVSQLVSQYLQGEFYSPQAGATAPEDPDVKK